MNSDGKKKDLRSESDCTTKEAKILRSGEEEKK